MIAIKSGDEVLALVKDDSTLVSTNHDDIKDWYRRGVPSMEGYDENGIMQERPVRIRENDPLFGLALLEQIESEGWHTEDDPKDEFSQEIQVFAEAAQSGLKPGTPEWSEVVKKAWLVRKANSIYKEKGEDAAKEYLKQNAPHLLEKWKVPKEKKSEPSEKPEPAHKEAEKISTPVLETDQKSMPKSVEEKNVQMEKDLAASKQFGGPVITGMTQFDGQKGSNPGGWYKFQASGKEVYVKDYDNIQRTQSEHLANEIYKELGVHVPTSVVIDRGPKSYIGLLKVDGAKPMTAKEMSEHPDVQKGFLADVLLRNWDAVGMQHDNIMLGADGHAYRIDQGGSLAFRAKGALKGDAGANIAHELTTMKDGNKNPAAAKVFGKYTPTDADIKNLKTLTDAKIDLLVKSNINNTSLAYQYSNQLKARRDSIVGMLQNKPVEAKEPEIKKLHFDDKEFVMKNEHGKVLDRRTSQPSEIFNSIESMPEYKALYLKNQAETSKTPEFSAKAETLLSHQYSSNSGYLSPARILKTIDELPVHMKLPAMKMAGHLTEASQDFMKNLSGDGKHVVLYRGVNLGKDDKYNWDDKREIQSYSLSKAFTEKHSYVIEAKIPIEKIHMFLPLVSRSFKKSPAYSTELEALVLQDKHLKENCNIYYKGKLLDAEGRKKHDFADEPEPEIFTGEITPLMFLMAAIAKINGMKLSPYEVVPLQPPVSFVTLLKAIRPILFEGTTEGAYRGWLTRKGGATQEDENHPQGKFDKEGKRVWVERSPTLPSDSRVLHYDMISDKPSAERAKEHEKIINRFANSAKPVPPTKIPVAIVMMGGPASGKSSIVEGISKKNFVNVNPDLIKEQLPEYKQALKEGAKNASMIVHEESSDIARKVKEQAITQNKNMVIDGTGSNYGKYLDMINGLKSRGYHVKLIMPDLDVDSALKRVEERAEKKGRWVPEPFVRQAYNAIPANFLKLTQAADDFALYNARTRPTKLVWERKEGKTKIHDKAFVDKFTGAHNFSSIDQMKNDKNKGGDKNKPLSVDLDEVMNDAMDHHEKCVDAFLKLPKKFVKGEGIEDPQTDGIS